MLKRLFYFLGLQQSRKLRARAMSKNLLLGLLPFGRFAGPLAAIYLWQNRGRVKGLLQSIRGHKAELPPPPSRFRSYDARP